ncbi:hypothetical protein [Allorhizocola rhizosphaerae]|uniref:hypothetical protein n=1 Tax=Allorhizocola rhizosphaerae TaxID=1872709 RepID=UPI000E3B7815|nr:hypothetical protein [Allorhizocola rhizosphaerae]
MFRHIMTAATLTVGTTVAVLAASSLPVAAHDLNRSLDYFGIRATGAISQGHTRIENCDKNNDGYGTRTRYVMNDGREDYVGDPNGTGAGCGSETTPPGKTVISFKICFRPVGPDEYCTVWISA